MDIWIEGYAKFVDGYGLYGYASMDMYMWIRIRECMDIWVGICGYGYGHIAIWAWCLDMLAYAYGYVDMDMLISSRYPHIHIYLSITTYP